MATKAYTKYIGITLISIIALLGWFDNSKHFDVERMGNVICAGDYENPCEWGYNITLITIQTYYIQNRNSTQFDFLPEVKDFYNCKKDGRYSASWRVDRELAPCGIGWREFDWKTPLTSKYKYINKFYKNKKQEFKIVVFKHNPSDEIKFGGEITKDKFDPYFYGVISGINLTIIKDCKTKTVYESCDRVIIHYSNYTFINNQTGINISMQDIYNYIEKYNCNPSEVEYDCITLGIETDKIKIVCPPNTRCDVIGTEWCMLDHGDGSKYFNAKQHLEKGWSRSCTNISDLKQGMEISISDFKKSIAKVEKLVLI